MGIGGVKVEVFFIYFLLTGLLCSLVWATDASNDNQFIFRLLVVGFIVGFLVVPYKFILGLIQFIKENSQKT
jgi:hypothetical protein